jgi:glycine betaine transporter
VAISFPRKRFRPCLFYPRLLIAPVALSTLWLGIFGSTAIHIDLFGAGGIGAAVSKDVTSALFITLSYIPGGDVFAIVATILIATFFITSADSATFCIGMYSSGGDLEPDTGLKVFWGLIEGGITAALILSGGIAALKASSILSAFPFMLITCGIIYCIFKSFGKEFSHGRYVVHADSEATSMQYSTVVEDRN